jgi:glycosyltransferase involved in cell wall biosynthesis
MDPLSTYPFVTIVTVVYNSKENLVKTIRNVIAQDYEKIEYIVIDGGSSDGSSKVIREYDPYISAWISEKNEGIYQAMNKGTQMASGEWICFLNAGDCFANPDTVSRVVKKIENLQEKPDVVYGNTCVEKRKGKLTERVAKKPCNSHLMYFFNQSAFVKTSVMRRYLFDENYCLSADFKFFKQCYYDKRVFVHLNFPIIIYDMRGISNMQREKGLQENIAVIKALDKGFGKYVFLLRLYFVIYWRRLTGKSKC